MNTLTNEQQKSYQIEKICYICKEKVKENMLKITIIVNIGTIVIIQGNIDVPYVTCLEENTEKYITFSVPIKKKVTRIDKRGEEITKVKCRLRFIGSATFVASLLSSLVTRIIKKSLIKS